MRAIAASIPGIRRLFLISVILLVAVSGCMAPPPTTGPVFVPPAIEGKNQAGTAALLQKNVVVILDASGSMRDRTFSSLSKMEAAKAALWEVLKRLPEDTNIGLLVFGATNIGDGWAYPLTYRHDATLQRAINYPNPFRDTPLGAFIKKGADSLLQQRAKQNGYGTYRLLIVTDGQATDPKLVKKYLPEVLARGIRIDVVGIKMGTEHGLAKRVHSYRNGSDLESLKKALTDAIAEVDVQGSDLATQETFSGIAPLPDELIRAILKALCERANHPIGEKPKLDSPGSS